MVNYLADYVAFSRMTAFQPYTHPPQHSAPPMTSGYYNTI